jgi:hypothetical protein
VTLQTKSEISLDTLLTTLVPPGAGYARLIAENENEQFFRRAAGRWRALDREGQGLEVFIAANVAVTFSAVGWATSAAGAIAGVNSVWCGVPYRLASPRAHEPRPRVLGGEPDRVLSRLAGTHPSILIDGGCHAMAIWLLDRSFTDRTALERSLRKLALSLAGDCAVADIDAGLPIPGTLCQHVYPSRTIEVVVWEPQRRSTLDRIITVEDMK